MRRDAAGIARQIRTPVATAARLGYANGSAALKSSVRCYGVKIWQDGKLVRDFRPCMKNGAGCLYDAVARKIFYPLGGALEAVERQVATQGPIPS